MYLGDVANVWGSVLYKVWSCACDLSNQGGYFSKNEDRHAEQHRRWARYTELNIYTWTESTKEHINASNSVVHAAVQTPTFQRVKNFRHDGLEEFFLDSTCNRKREKLPNPSDCQHGVSEAIFKECK